MDNELEQFTLLWSSAEQVIRLYLNSVIYNRSDAQDLLQRTALCAFRKFKNYNAEQPFQAWVYGIAKYEVLSYFRSLGRNHEITDSEISERLVENIEDQSERLAQEEEDRNALLEKLLREIPPKAQELIRLRFFENLGYDEIARRFNTNEGAVRTAVSRIIAKMREMVKAAREEEMA